MSERMIRFTIPAVLSILSVPSAASGETMDVTPHVHVTFGAVNSVRINARSEQLFVYRCDKRYKGDARVFLTSGRRDLVEPSRAMIDVGTKAVAPEAAKAWLENPGEFWKSFATSRFHDYAQQTTKVPAKPLAVTDWVQDGDVIRAGIIDARPVEMRVVETAGYTRDAVSYIATIDGKKIAFTGDLIYGDGKIFDLYSLQDAIPEANIRGYHGYGSRLASLVTSLQKIAAEKPDLIVPVRGPVIRDPQASIERLVTRVRKLYHNYLSTNALHWYFKEDRMRLCGERVLGEGADVDLMPYSEHRETPDWIFENSTSRMLISDDGYGFLLDCGSQRVIDAIKRLMETGVIRKVEGIFVTHYHDDHTDMVQAAAEEFGCPVYATGEYSDILENPGAYHMPAMTPNAIRDIRVMNNGETMDWHEFKLTFHFFPGQTIYHGALFVERPDERPVFFIGDAFAPSGMDDYCVLNRNLVHDDDGYLLCLSKLRDVRQKFWLINEHIPHVFAFSPSEMDYLKARYRDRIATLRELFPWDDPNYGIDEQWAVFHPYGIELKPGEEREVELRITNHSSKTRTFHVGPRTYGGLTVAADAAKISVPSRGVGRVPMKVRSIGDAGHHLVSVDLRSDGMEFRDWTEALVTVGESE